MVQGIGQERGHQRIVRRVGDVKRPSNRGAQNFGVVFNRRIHGSFGYKADSKRPSTPLANRSKNQSMLLFVKASAGRIDRATGYPDEEGPEFGA
jgi:hypothetical protein